MSNLPHVQDLICSLSLDEIGEIIAAQESAETPEDEDTRDQSDVPTVRP